MSLKIYNGYILKEQLDMYELNKFMDELRKKVNLEGRKRIQNMVIKDFLYFYYYGKVHGADKIKEMVEKTAEDLRVNHIWKALLDGDWSKLFHKVYWRILKEIHEASNDQTLDSLTYDFSSELMFFPLKTKTLLMYFGYFDVKGMITGSGQILDYHYQNQTDRPENISYEEWKQREADWNEAIGPDFIPINHGFSICLFNHDLIIPRYDPELEIEFPSEEVMTSLLRDTFESISEVEGFPDDDFSVSRWLDWVDTEPYKKWEEKQNELIQSKCHFLRTKEELESLIKS